MLLIIIGEKTSIVIDLIDVDIVQISKHNKPAVK